MYDGNTDAELNYDEVNLEGMLAGDNLRVTATGEFADRNAGKNKPVAISDLTLTGADKNNYYLAGEGQQESTTAEIYTRLVNILGITAKDKVYDGTPAVEFDYSNVSFEGLLEGDELTVTCEGRFLDAQKGNGRMVYIENVILGGRDKDNYALDENRFSNVTTANITVRAVTVTADNISVTYGEAPTLTVTYDGLADGETSVPGTLDFDCDYQRGMNVGSYTITPKGLIEDNYTITYQSGTLTVTPREITVSKIKGVDKVYDGNRQATLDYSKVKLEGKLEGDDLSVTATGTFDANYGGLRRVILTDLTLTGAAKDNYVLAETGQQKETTASILIKEVRISGITAKDKTYDGTTDVTFVYDNMVIDGLVEGDILPVTAEGCFEDANAGEGKVVSITNLTLDLSGLNGLKYKLAEDGQQAQTTANISRRPVTVSGITAQSKDYDGNTSAALNCGSAAFGNLLPGDTLTVTATGTFDTASAGADKTVNITDLTLGGSAAGNYCLAESGQQTTAMASISKAGLTVYANVCGITYGDAPANKGVGYIGFVGGDTEASLGGTLTYTYTYSQYGDVGSYQIQPGGLTSNDYDITFNPGDLLVEQREITILWGNTSHTYDGQRWSPDAAAGNTVNGDQLTLTIEGAQQNVGAYTAQVTGITGAKAGNYKLPGETTTSFDIGPAAMTITADDKSIIYGADAPAYTVTYVGLAQGEDGTNLDGTLTFDCAYAPGMDAATYTITPKGVTSQNYNIRLMPGTLTVDKRTVDIAWGSESLTYNGLEQHPSATIANLYGTDDVALTVTGAVDAGDSHTAQVIDITGSKAGNYALPADTACTFAIAKRELTITGAAVEPTKVYDGTAAATITSFGTLENTLPGDDVTMVTGTAAYDSKNVGVGKTVTFTGFALTGAKADNYCLTAQPASLTADITAKEITLEVTVKDKPFDGSTSAEIDALTHTDFVEGDDITLVNGTPSFAYANVGRDIPVSFTEFRLEGADAGNYILTNSIPENITASITPTSDYLDMTPYPEEDEVWINGRKYPVQTDGGRYVRLPGEVSLLTTYTMAASGDYPVGMKVYRVECSEEGATMEEIPEFDNLLLYAGCSIRLSSIKGIRMITTIGQSEKSSLTGKSGLAGYTLEEYGTVVMRGVGEPTLETSQSYNYAYKKGTADPIFGRANGRIQYTNVLIGFSLDDCKDVLTMRPYIVLRDMATGQTVTLYGGCVSRSIGYIAKQNENTYKPGTIGYKYVHEIIEAVYGQG